jgi:hypothetical protein
MSAMTVVPDNDPLMRAWNEFKQTEEFANAKKWASHPEHLDGSLWALFDAGFRAATVRAVDLHEQVDTASNAERLNNLPGAGAMGAIIEYRDKISRTIAA